MQSQQFCNYRTFPNTGRTGKDNQLPLLFFLLLIQPFLLPCFYTSRVLQTDFAFLLIFLRRFLGKSGILSAHSPCNRGWQKCREDDMTAVHYQNCPGSSTIGCIDQTATLPRLLNHPLNRCRFRADDGNHSLRGNHVSKTDIN
jgi:hypothetical protein